MAACVFCRIVAGDAPAKIVHEDDDVLAFLDIRPITRGHTLVIPKRHAAVLDDLDPALGGKIFAVAHSPARAVRRGDLAADGANLLINDGKAAFQTIRHVHMHVIPRGNGDLLRFGSGFVLRRLRDADATAEAIRAGLRGLPAHRNTAKGTPMSGEIDQQTITEALFEEWDVIGALLGELDEEQWRLAVPLPGWDVHATVAHLIGTESMLLGIDPPTAETISADHIRNPIGAFNEQWVGGLKQLTGAQMLARFREVTERRRAALAALTAEQWQEISPTTPVGPAPYGRFMRIRLFDCWMHELDIRDAVGHPGYEGGTRGELALAEIVPNLGFTIGKRGKAPVGSRIALHLDGPLTRDIYLDVPERARLVDALDGPATVAITLDSGLFARLFGGRTSADAHSDAITAEGDQALARQLLDNFATTL